MTRILITGSTEGLGLAAARELLASGHEVVLHARSTERAAALGELRDRCDVVVGDLDWRRKPWRSSQAYSDSKLFVTALALAVARRWPGVRSNAVDPGWVPTRMGGPGAPDDLEAGHRSQVRLATGELEGSGGYRYHERRWEPAAPAADARFQESLLAELARLTGVPLP